MAGRPAAQSSVPVINRQIGYGTTLALTVESHPIGWGSGRTLSACPRISRACPSLGSACSRRSTRTPSTGNTDRLLAKTAGLSLVQLAVTKTRSRQRRAGVLVRVAECDRVQRAPQLADCDARKQIDKLREWSQFCVSIYRHTPPTASLATVWRIQLQFLRPGRSSNDGCHPSRNRA
jgi:hypothetical protein